MPFLHNIHFLFENGETHDGRFDFDWTGGTLVFGWPGDDGSHGTSVPDLNLGNHLLRGFEGNETLLDDLWDDILIGGSGHYEQNGGGNDVSDGARAPRDDAPDDAHGGDDDNDNNDKWIEDLPVQSDPLPAGPPAALPLTTAFAATTLAAEVALFTETFDDASGFTVTTGSFFSDGSSDYLGINDGAGGGDYGGGPAPSGSKAYTGFTGSYLEGQDLNGEGGPIPVTVTWTGIDISGQVDLAFSGDFAEFFDFPGDIDSAEFIKVEYQIDGGGFQRLLTFEGADFTSSSGTFNGNFRQDTDFDGEGDGIQLTGAAQTFEVGIAGTGSTLDLRLLVNVEAGDEDFAVDNFTILANSDAPLPPPPPPPAPFVAIYDIQGAGHISSFNGDQVKTAGVVTALESFGFFMQDAVGDGDDATSDAIFVVTGGPPGFNIGDSVAVEGIVEESFPGSAATGNLSTTRINDIVEIERVSSGNPLPGAVILGQNGRTPPTEIIEDLQFEGNPEVFADNVDDYSTDGADGSFGDFDPANDGLDFYESLEGMLVTVKNAIALSGSNRFGEVFVAADNGADVTGGNARGGVTIATDAARSDFNPERIQIDPDSQVSGFGLPDIDTGDTLGDVTGVVGYSFGNFELIPTVDFRDQIVGSNLEAESTGLQGGEEELTVATYNVLNLDPNDADDGNDDMDVANGRFDAIAAHIVNNLSRPDIIALQEIQDNNGTVDDGTTSADVTLQLLVDAIIDAGGPAYTFIDNPGVVDGAGGGVPGGNIRTAFLYNADRVDLVEGSVTATTDTDLSDGNAFLDSRVPLQATFTFDDEDVTVINVHSSSKGGSTPLFGGVQPPINGGLVDERVPQSEVIKDVVDDILADDPDANVIVMGDFNEFDFNESVQLLVEDGTLNNLSEDLAVEERYTFAFRGNAQSLDHILVTDGLDGVAEVDIVHVNVEFAATDERASDHDPIVARFNFDNLDDDSFDFADLDDDDDDDDDFDDDNENGSDDWSDHVGDGDIEEIGLLGGWSGDADDIG